MDKNRRQQGLGLHGSRVYLKQLGDEAQTYRFDQNDAWVEQALSRQIPEIRKAGVPAHFNATLARQGKNFLLDGELHLELVPLCDRCGKTFTRSIDQSFQLMLISASARDAMLAKPNRTAQQQSVDDEEGEGWGSDDGLSFEDESAMALPGEEVDLAEIFAEQALLSVPMTFLCRQDCPGLCPHCGADLAVTRCNCKEDSRDPRWQALKGIKVKS